MSILPTRSGRVSQLGLSVETEKLNHDLGEEYVKLQEKAGAKVGAEGEEAHGEAEVHHESQSYASVISMIRQETRMVSMILLLMRLRSFHARYSNLHVRVRCICVSGSDYAIFAVKLFATIASVLIATATGVRIWLGLVLVPLGVQTSYGRHSSSCTHLSPSVYFSRS